MFRSKTCVRTAVIRFNVCSVRLDLSPMVNQMKRYTRKLISSHADLLMTSTRQMMRRQGDVFDVSTLTNEYRRTPKVMMIRPETLNRSDTRDLHNTYYTQRASRVPSCNVT